MDNKKDTSTNTSTPGPVANLEIDLEQGLLSNINTAMANAEPAHIDVKSFFSFLKLGGINEEEFKHIKLDEESATKMKNHMISMKHGTYAAVPLMCQGHKKCPIISQCWFAKRQKDGSIDEVNSNFPLLRPCPVESSVIQLKVQQYVTEFVGDVNVNVTPTTLALITKLAELDIYEIRCDMILSSGDSLGQGRDMLAQTVEAINENTGDVIHGVKEHPIIATKERLQKQRDKILSQLVATPEAKINAKSKLVGGDKSDLSNQITDLRNMLNKAIGAPKGNDTSQYGNPNLQYLDSE